MKELNLRPVATQRGTVVSLSALSLIINEPVVTIFRRQRALHEQSSNSGPSGAAGPEVANGRTAHV